MISPLLSPATLRLAAILSALAVSFGAGWRVAAWRADAQRVSSVERAINQANLVAEQDREVLSAGAGREVRTEAVFRSIEKEVIRYVKKPVAAAVCLDADGLRLWAAANTGDWEDGSAPPRHTLSGFAGPGLGNIGRPAGQPRDDDAGLSPVPGQAPDAGGVDGEPGGGQ